MDSILSFSFDNELLELLAMEASLCFHMFINSLMRHCCSTLTQHVVLGLSIWACNL